MAIRSISDFADSNKNDEWQDYAAHCAAAWTFAFLRSGPIPCASRNSAEEEEKPKKLKQAMQEIVEESKRIEEHGICARYDENRSPLVANELNFLDRLFTTLNAPQPILLLAQADRDKSIMHRAILEKAKQRFGLQNCFHLVPLPFEDASVKDYFAYLARQCDLSFLESNDPAVTFQFMLDERLQEGMPIFLFISRIDEGAKEGRLKLAKVLRSLSEQSNYREFLNLVICGAEQLADLRYAKADSSLLSNAEVFFWPEPNVADIQKWQENISGPFLEHEEAEQLVQLCGGHPRLLKICLQARHEQGRSLKITDYRNMLFKDELLKSRFINYRKIDGREQKKLFQWLEKEKLEHFDHWPDDQLLRRLFWDNLLIERDGYFAWRCEFIQSIGKEVLQHGRSILC